MEDNTQALIEQFLAKGGAISVDKDTIKYRETKASKKKSANSFTRVIQSAYAGGNLLDMER